MSKPIRKELIKHSKCGEDFQNDSKKFIVNMTSQKKKLHIKNTQKCDESKFAYDYLDFDDEKSAREFFKSYGKDISRCEHCFKDI